MYGHINFRSGYLYTILTGGNRQFIKCELRCLFIHLISFFFVIQSHGVVFLKLFLNFLLNIKLCNYQKAILTKVFY